MTVTITAFKASPDRGRGLARDMRVRWALEELGQPYEVRLETFAELKQAEHLERNPFGQIPTLEEEDGLVLFESGAIVMRLAERHGGLLPTEADARSRAIMWMFAALNTVEPPIFERSMATVLEADKPWSAERLGMLDDRVKTRLSQLSVRLGEAEWLDGDFSAGDLLMITVLMRADAGGLVQPFPNLVAYLARGRERPAFQRAFEAQRVVFQASQAQP